MLSLDIMTTIAVLREWSKAYKSLARLTPFRCRFMAASRVLGEETVSGIGTTAATATHNESRSDRAKKA